MQSKNDVIINATKWLGDANILTMDWDCQGMLFRLILISSQQTQQGYLSFNETLIRKVLSNPTEEDWVNRIRPQILSVLKVKKMEVDGIHGEYLYYPEYIKALDEANGVAEKPVKKPRKKKITVDIGAELVDNEHSFQGFSLDTIIKAKASTTILYEKTSQEVNSSIWDVGVSILMPQKKDEAGCRKLIGRTIKTYGAAAVSAAIAEISGKNLQAANMEAFFIGIVKSKSQAIEGVNADGTVATQAKPLPKNNRPTKYNNSNVSSGKVIL